MPSPSRAAAPHSSLPWPFPPTVLPVWMVGIAGWWWREIRLQLEAAPTLGAAWGLEALTWLGLAGRVASAFTEAAAYTLWWRGRGARLSFWRFLCWVASLSTTDLMGFAVRRAAGDSNGLVGALAVMLAGPIPLGGGDESGVTVAFGGLGVLTLLRMTGTGWAQARSLGCGLMGPISLTAGTWLTSRLVVWWSYDLARGLSPVR